MNTAGRLSAYGVALALVAGGGWAVGTAVGPLAGPAGETAAEGAGHGDPHGGTVAETERAGALPDQPDGLSSSRGGYTLTPTSTTLTPGRTTPFSFTITSATGAPVTGFEVEHDKRMHLIVVRRDTANFQHVHPEPAADGTWTAPLNLERAGSYRAFADFAPSGGEPVTLGVDLSVPGEFLPETFAPSRVSEIDGYRVILDGELAPGRTASLRFTVHRDGRPVTDLEPYLGSSGHLVALRAGDLAYLHVHPDGGAGGGPVVAFAAEVPTAGRYRLFLDFRHAGTVRTAAFTVDSPGLAQPAPVPPAVPPTGDGQGHGDGHGHG